MIEISKNDLGQGITNKTSTLLNYKNNTTHKDINQGYGITSSLESVSNVDIVRGEVIQIQKEESNLQTQLSTTQSILEAIHEFNDSDKSTVKKEELEFFLQSKNKKLSNMILSDNDLDQYISDLNSQIGTIKRELSKQQIKSENIFASKLFHNIENIETLNVSFLKNIDDISSIMKSFSKENIKTLLQ